MRYLPKICENAVLGVLASSNTPISLQYPWYRDWYSTTAFSVDPRGYAGVKIQGLESKSSCSTLRALAFSWVLEYLCLTKFWESTLDSSLSNLMRLLLSTENEASERSYRKYLLIVLRNYSFEMTKVIKNQDEEDFPYFLDFHCFCCLLKNWMQLEIWISLWRQMS